MTICVTARIPSYLSQNLDFLTHHLERSKSYIVVKALEAYIERQIEDICDGEFALATEMESNGECMTWDEAEKIADRIRAEGANV